MLRPLATFLLWIGLWRRDARLSMICMYLGDIQRGQRGRFRMGGTGSKVLMVWNLAYNPLSYASGVGGLSRNPLLPWR